MKRFVTYLYEYERGNKVKNVGFIRVNVRGVETSMEVYVRNFLRGNSNGKIVALIYQNVLLGIELEKIEIKNGQSDTRLMFSTEDIRESLFSLNDIVGIGICMDGGAYIASCWKDMCEDEIGRGEFTLWEKKKELETDIETIEEASILKQEINYEEKRKRHSDSVTYEKIDLSQIRDLPSPNWHLTTNSFLVHGFWNYGYLVLKKELAENKETCYLGVPGIFEKPEAVMAVLFGFPSFEEIPQEIVSATMNQPRQFSDIKKNQEEKVGTFGSWFVELQH